MYIADWGEQSHHIQSSPPIVLKVLGQEALSPRTGSLQKAIAMFQSFNLKDFLSVSSIFHNFTDLFDRKVTKPPLTHDSHFRYPANHQRRHLPTARSRWFHLGRSWSCNGSSYVPMRKGNKSCERSWRSNGRSARWQKRSFLAPRGGVQKVLLY